MFITSPNADSIYAPPLGSDRSVFLCADFRYGNDELAAAAVGYNRETAANSHTYVRISALILFPTELTSVGRTQIILLPRPLLKDGKEIGHHLVINSVFRVARDRDTAVYLEKC